MDLNQVEKQKKPTILTKHPNLFALGLSVIILAGGFGYVNPNLQTKQELSQKDVGSLERTLEQKQRQLIRIKKLLETTQTLTPEQIVQLDESLPPTPKEVDLLANMAALVEESELTASSIGIAVSAPQFVPGVGVVELTPFEVQEVIVTLDLRGISYIRLKRLVDNIEHNLRLLRLDKFAFASDQEGTQIVMTAYYMPGN